MPLRSDQFCAERQRAFGAHDIQHEFAASPSHQFLNFGGGFVYVAWAAEHDVVRTEAFGEV